MRALQLGHLIGAGLVPSDDDVEELAVDQQVFDVRGRDRGMAAREEMGDGILRILRAADDRRDDLAFLQQVDRPAQQEVRLLFVVVFPEEHAPFGAWRRDVLRASAMTFSAFIPSRARSASAGRRRKDYRTAP